MSLTRQIRDSLPTRFPLVILKKDDIYLNIWYVLLLMDMVELEELRIE